MNAKYTVSAVSEAQNQSQSLFRYIAPELILPNPKQPRRSIEHEALNTLKESIRERGILQPLLVMRGEDGKYILVAGQRRLAAAKEIGLVRVPVMVLNEIRPDFLVDSLLENIQREELSGIDEGHSFIALKEEFDWSQREIAARIHKHESYVSERIRTAERLTAITKEIISEAFVANQNLARAKFSHSINRKLALLPAEEQEELARYVASSPNITARQVEGLVREKLSSSRGLAQVFHSSLEEAEIPAEVKSLEQAIVPKKPRSRQKSNKNAYSEKQLTLLGEGFEVPLQNVVEEPSQVNRKKAPLPRLTLEYNLARIDPAMQHTLELLADYAVEGKNIKLEDLIEVIKEDCREISSGNITT
ncbi:MAG TPA: ParB/RepB/Spo0J family partition protein [Chloroflexia bacterium]|nr:ParB/RepB/Spo0J family partition protein [Chloroflexia bacterium]